jgi:hypothetical protein
LAQLFFQFGAARREKMNEIRINSCPIRKLHTVRTAAEQLSIIGRLIDDDDGGGWLYPKFMR